MSRLRLSPLTIGAMASEIQPILPGRLLNRLSEAESVSGPVENSMTFVREFLDDLAGAGDIGGYPTLR